MAPELAIPKGSLVLVTGANGYIGSHVADQLMTAGYKVRGTARSEAKAKTIAGIFEKRHGKDAFTYTVIEDMGAANAFNQAIKGEWRSALFTEWDVLGSIFAHIAIRLRWCCTCCI